MASYDDTATVSGSVVGFSNGADSVPLKNWLVTLPASLDGYTEVNGYKQGANVIDYTSNLTTGTSGGLTFSVTADGGISYSGTASSTFAYVTAKFDFSIKSGQTFTFSRNTAFSYIHRITLTFSDDTTANVSISANDTSVTYTPAKDVKAVRLLVAGLTTSASYNDTVYLQTEYGSTATAYEAYTAPTQYTASLDRTIYGGTADIVTGEGDDKGGIEVFDTIEGNVIKSQFNSFNKVNGNISVLGTNVRITFAIESGDQSAYNRISNTYTADEQLCSLAPHSFSYASDTKHWYRNTVLYLFLPVADVGTTAESVFNYLTGLITNGTPLKFYLPYNAATAFTFTPITPTPETAKGSNTFWSDQGNTELTYYKSGYGFTSVTIHKETPEGEPVEQTAKLHKIVYGGLIDVIQGKAEPKNLIPFEPISEYTYLGITYTQYSDGTVKINGTASGGLSFYRVIPNGSDGVHFKSGVAYTLSGCVGGSSTTYQLDLRVGNSVVGYYKNAIDYGRGYTFTATEDSVAYPLICVRNGTTVNNVIISPMVEVGSSASEYVPHFEPFSFPPISMETDEGENTLYADQGDSAITYRKAVD